MNDQTDQQLLRDYVERRSEAAFAEIVQRYIDLVYSAAFRMVCDAQAAKDVTQSVFVILAENARQLTDRPALAGWLHDTARNLAVKTIRSDVRRRAREQEVAAMNELLSADTDASWEHLAPHLDAALGELSEPDREALLLRYFKNHDLRTVGATLGISDDAAQKRVSRAVERLREFFAKRGITVGAGGLVAVLSAHAVQAAPVGLALTISTAVALTGTAIAATTTATAVKTIAMTTLQKTVITATVAVLAGVGIYEAVQNSQLREQMQTLRQQQMPLAGEIEQLRTERDEAARQLAALREDNERLNRNTGELPRLRGEVARLRFENEALTQNVKEAQEFQADMMRMISNTPPVRTFVATATASLTWDQALVMGGWKTPSGKRVITLVTLQPGDDPKQLTINSKVFEYTEDAAVKLGLVRFNIDEHNADGTIVRPKTHTITSEQLRAMLQEAKNTEGVELVTAPAVTTLSGRQAQVQTVEIRTALSGEKYSTGPVLDFIPTIASDGRSVQMTVSAQLNYRVQPPEH